MVQLLPFRGWRADPEILQELNQMLTVPRKESDRSQFVSYARMTQHVRYWIDEGRLMQDASPAVYKVSNGQQSWLVGMCVLGPEIKVACSVPPSEREHQQRILEATQCYFSPVLTTGIIGGNDSAIPSDAPVVKAIADSPIEANHLQVYDAADTFAAALAMQAELARPGKLRSSDYAMVAVALGQPRVNAQWLRFSVTPSRDHLEGLVNGDDITVICNAVSQDCSGASVKALLMKLGVLNWDLNSLVEEPDVDGALYLRFAASPKIKVPFRALSPCDSFPVGAIMGLVNSR